MPSNRFYNIQMSIYSGFPTRRDEQKYNSLLVQLLTTLQQHLISLLPPDIPISPRLLKSYSRILSRMKDYQEHKYLPPKFSQVVETLAKTIGVEVVEKKIEIDEGDEREKQKTKASSRSLHKHKFNMIGLEHFTEVSRKVEIGLAKESSEHGTFPNRPLFQSCSSKLARPKALKGIFPADHRVELAEQYHQESSQGEPLPGLVRGRVESNGGIAKKHRYRAFQALHEAQSQINKRNVPLREEMRKKLRTEG